MGAEQGFSVDQLMELAGLAVAEAVVDAWPERGQRVLVACGPGNNGGDGLVAARHLHHAGYRVQVLWPVQKPVDLYQRLARQLRQLGVPVASALEPLEAPFDVLVDAVFGYSFTGDMRAPFAELLPRLRDLRVGRVCAVDVPSGWHVEQGDVQGLGWMPHMLVSLTAPKECARHFRGQWHYIGGHFVPPLLSQRYGISYIDAMYKGAAQVARLQ